MEREEKPSALAKEIITAIDQHLTPSALTAAIDEAISRGHRLVSVRALLPEHYRDYLRDDVAPAKRKIRDSVLKSIAATAYARRATVRGSDDDVLIQWL